MTTPFDYYARTPRGQRLAAIINDPARYFEYRAFSREGFPAVTALVSLLRPELEPLRSCDRQGFDAAKKFIGWAVGTIMRDRGHEIVGRRRVPGGLFTVGAIWNASPAMPVGLRSATPAVGSRNSQRAKGRDRVGPKRDASPKATRSVLPR